jgi:dCTP deaminase
VDLRLGTKFHVFNNNRQTHIDPLKKENTFYAESVHIKPLEPFVLHPNQFALASSLEYLKIPSDIAGRLEGRSTWGRLGLQIHSTAGFVDPGFSGSLTYELQNVGNVPISLYPGMRVAQLCFYETNKSLLPYENKKYSKYGSYTGAISSKYSSDPECELFKNMKDRGNIK